MTAPKQANVDAISTTHADLVVGRPTTCILLETQTRALLFYVTGVACLLKHSGVSRNTIRFSFPDLFFPGRGRNVGGGSQASERRRRRDDSRRSGPDMGSMGSRRSSGVLVADELCMGGKPIDVSGIRVLWKAQYTALSSCRNWC